MKESNKDALSSWISSIMISAILKDNSDCKSKATSIKLSFQNEENLLTLSFDQLIQNLNNNLNNNNQNNNQNKNYNLNNNNNNNNNNQLRNNNLNNNNENNNLNNNNLNNNNNNENKEQEKILICTGIMRLFCVWLQNSPKSINYFLQPHKHLEFLVSNILQPEGDAHFQGLCALLLGICFLFSDHQIEEENNNKKNKNNNKKNNLKNNNNNNNNNLNNNANNNNKNKNNNNDNNNNDNNNEKNNWRETLHGIITQRIGIDKFVDKLDKLKKSSAFQFSEENFEFSNSPLFNVINLDLNNNNNINNNNNNNNNNLKNNANEVLDLLLFFDPDFTIFFKEVYGSFLFSFIFIVLFIH